MKCARQSSEGEPKWWEEGWRQEGRRRKEGVKGDEWKRWAGRRRGRRRRITSERKSLQLREKKKKDQNVWVQGEMRQEGERSGAQQSRWKASRPKKKIQGKRRRKGGVEEYLGALNNVKRWRHTLGWTQRVVMHLRKASDQTSFNILVSF